MKIENSDFASLVETRVVLEIEAAKFAAIRRTDEDIIAMNKALVEHEKIVKKGLPAVEQDLMFHLKIAEASKNSVLKSLMLIIAPDIIKSFNEHELCKDGRSYQALHEHKEIVNHIINQDSAEAALSMKAHLKEVLEYSYGLK